MTTFASLDDSPVTSDEEGGDPDWAFLNEQLNPATLAALRVHKGLEVEAPTHRICESSGPSKSHVPVAVSVSALEAIISRLSGADFAQTAASEGRLQFSPDAHRSLLLDQECGDSAASKRVLETQGVLRLNRCLPAEVCDALLLSVNKSLDKAISDENPCFDRAAGFGQVLERRNRYDMMLVIYANT